ncbi:MAG: methyltransferase domain-containing protein [Bryobacterales bacterium]|nr:methyltransferase domain-containing protein [Bryobacterales bacterium]
MQQLESACTYNTMAEHYHLLYSDWRQHVSEQSGILGPLLETQLGPGPLKLLDCTCGIGTQAIGLSQRGHHVTAADFCEPALHRARIEAARAGVSIDLRHADIRHLDHLAISACDAVLAMENSIPHLLTDEQLAQAFRATYSVLRPGGLFVMSMGDFDLIAPRRTRFQGPVFHSEGPFPRILHQVWEWLDERTFRLHLFITRELGEGWQSLHFPVVYRALLRGEVTDLLTAAGYTNIRWLMPAESGFFQPIAMAARPMEHTA